MNGATLKKKLIAIYGKDFHPAVVKECNVDISTIYRWIAAPKVPGLVAAWITAKATSPKASEPAQ